jgi:hypothetical protein
MAPPRNHQNPFGQSRLGNEPRQYQRYSIFINGSSDADDIVMLGRFIRPFAPKNVDDWLHQQWKRAYFSPRPDNRPFVRQYERSILFALDTIRSSKIGTCLFESLNPDYPVRIVPYRGGQDVCNALTGDAPTGDETDGVQVQFSTETWDYSDCGKFAGHRAHEVLFHEMVHASRFTRLSDADMNNDPLEQNKNYEEFLAVMLCNSFMSERGGQVFEIDYMTQKESSQAKVEQFLSSKRVLIGAIKYFLDDELVKVVAKLPMPFNVFRDFQRLKDAYNNSPAGKASPYL